MARLSQTSYTRRLLGDELTPADVERLAALVGLRLPPEALEPLARSLSAHGELVAPLFERDLSDVEPAVRFRPDADA
jgi:Asp-tRNA(Asn)/Glu-tRNA(Gln) amidotransferase C subunit